tara:strand:- start:539 stop:1435 length:897 start_codon:yes stop_codon:yes gene_type:complete
MLVGKVEHLNTKIFKDFFEITKSRLSISVVFSSITGYLLATETVDTLHILYLFLGGFCMVGASNTLNQVIERDYDAIMKRTQNRPIPKGRISIPSALIISLLMIILGFFLLNKLNLKTAFFSFFSILIYVLIYTPLKTITPLSVFIGAFPGAIPFMLGWVSATNKFGIEPGILFMLQFFWQFPHFWAISWVMHDDYQKAGFKMLPTGNKDRKTAFQITFYTLWMILISLIPYTHYSGSLSLTQNSALLILTLGIIMLYFSIDLMVKKSNKAASKLIIVSIFYLSLVQLIFIFDKYFLA